MNETHSKIRQLLLQDWDPHEIANRPEAQTAYDAWLAPLHQLLQSNPTEQQIIDWLHEREKETMCFPSVGQQRLKRVAQKLIQLRFCLLCALCVFAAIFSFSL